MLIKENIFCHFQAVLLVGTKCDLMEDEQERLRLMEANDAVNVINGTPISIKEGKSFIWLTHNMPALFSEDYFSMKKGFWRFEIS